MARSDGGDSQFPARTMFYDRQGQPITIEQYAENHEKDYRVAQDILIMGDEPVQVSTVWLGIDMGFIAREGGRPIIFETMIFGGPCNGYQVRYATELDAQEGHARIIADLRAGLHQPAEEVEAADGAAQQD